MAPANGTRLAELPTTIGLEVGAWFEGDLQNTTFGGGVLATAPIVGLGLALPFESVNGAFGSLNFVDDDKLKCQLFAAGQGVSWALTANLCDGATKVSIPYSIPDGDPPPPRRPPTSVPEPALIVMMATGLLSVTRRAAVRFSRSPRWLPEAPDEGSDRASQS